MKALKFIGALIVPVLEALAVLMTIYWPVATLKRLPWRAWVDSAAAAEAIPDLIIVAATLLLMYLGRKRWGLPVQAAIPGGNTAAGLFAWATIIAVPGVLLLSVNTFQSAKTLSLISAAGVLASVATTLRIAVLEEFLYRYVMLGRFIRSGLPATLAISLNTLLFWWIHSKGARIDTPTILWYLTAGCTMASLYLATGRILYPILFHFSVDASVAQASPASYWLTHRTVDTLLLDWKAPTVVVLLLLNGGYWAWRFYNPPHGCLSRPLGDRHDRQRPVRPRAALDSRTPG